MKNKRTMHLLTLLYSLLINLFFGLIFGLIFSLGNDTFSFWHHLFDGFKVMYAMGCGPFYVYCIIALLFPKFDDYLEAKYVNISGPFMVVIWYYWGSHLGGVFLEDLFHWGKIDSIFIAFIIVHIFMLQFNKERM